MWPHESVAPGECACERRRPLRRHLGRLPRRRRDPRLPRYLASQYHDEFDAWAADFENPYDDLTGDDGRPQLGLRPALARARGRRRRRRGDLPQHDPAVLPGCSLVHAAAADGRDDARAALGRPAGAQPVARRLLRRPPGRRAGIAQIMLHDVDGAVEEISGPRTTGSPAASCCPARLPARGCPRCTTRTTSRSGRSARSSACRSTTTAAGGVRRRWALSAQTVMFLLEVTWWAHRDALAPHRRRRDGTPPDAAVRLHRAGHGVDPRGAATLDYYFDAHAHRGRVAGARVGPAGRRAAVADAERVLGPPVPRRLELHRPPEVPIRERSASTASCGAATSRTRSRARPSRGRHRGSPSPASTRRGALMVGGNAAALYGFDLDALAPHRRQGRPRRRRGGPAAAAGRLPGGVAEVPGVRGSRARRALSLSTNGEDHMSVDNRTRVDGEVESVDPRRCFEEVLPEAFERHQDLLAAAVGVFAPAPLVVEVDGDPWTLAVDGRRVRVRNGVDDAPGVVLRTNAAQLDDLVTDQVTVVGMQTNGTLDQPVGRFDALLDWWLLLRGALDARAPHTSGSIALVDADGVPLALRPQLPGRCPPRRDGRLPPPRRVPPHRGRVLGRRDGRGVARHGRAPRRRTRPTTDARGGLVTATATTCWCACSTSTRCHPRSSGLANDERLLRIAGLTGDGHVFGSMDDNRIEALFKPFDVVAGISDLPWHKDCALGRHSYDCCGMTVGISVTGADARRVSCGRSPDRTARSCGRRTTARPLRPAGGRPAHPHRRRHRAPVVHVAQVAAAGRPGTAGCSTPGSDCRCAAPTPSARHAATPRHPRGRAAEGASTQTRRPTDRASVSRPPHTTDD